MTYIHHIPVCEALRLLGFSGRAVMRAVGLSDNTWDYWRKGGQPRPESRAALVMLAKRTLAAARELLSQEPLLRAEDLQRAETLISQQEKQWALSPLSVLQGQRRMLAI